MPPVACPIRALLPTMAAPLLSISTAPKITVSRAQSGSLRLGPLLRPAATRAVATATTAAAGRARARPAARGACLTGWPRRLDRWAAADPGEEGRRLA